ncbi:protein-(glutamine-N5) methyltransferase, release factor-specific [Lacticaseibacillus chiayiensis]|uniref:Release factor glutamine methyltransferase n=1 Tax=Lacticaseibacillus chiayiensis TaxID=2100821 RepID=A0A4Q1TPL8_9LACO|nr:peptide chain release factor N(5)-glutamine methyltransferase [Lacticaseibacillus chiayiensis]QVI35642.1 peptide chain release factor N(5)-glutamine methyltransferase [Lacticaseibacillus chiayiensis]RXT20649.1 protein-(glutamine-N5) methyltransferase, release factor-specific [Lacticaseibacillus chiayiensis]RXT58304.1 protein-(glutamine-N5) methyltransferase, release factor-specific [Lacticaseibacillus chiayiensis]UYN57476.1 peptide chain release factor N(5)-glutamine methyltransferase [Lacti
MSKTYAEALKWASLLLREHQVDPDGARYVLMTRANWTPSQLILHRQDVMPDASWQQFQADVTRLIKFEPAQYITGVAPFFGAMFKVTPAVLIPRFETEELVDWVAKEQTAARNGLDLGTGSGAIGITLARQLPDVAMTLSDVSEAALTVAKQNAQSQHVQVQFVTSDLFSHLPGRFDFVVTNLPYIAPGETPVMDQSTLRYEPKLALFADHHGLALFERFIVALPAHLNDEGAAYLEFGYRQQPALQKLFAEKVPQAQVSFRQDMAGHPRMAKLQF